MANKFFPKDVVLEILARLPVKSLLRFQLVAKSWRDILKEPSFITKHQLTQVSLNHGNCVLTLGCMVTYRVGFALLMEDEQGIKLTSLELPFFKDLDKASLQVAGPCNGIFIVSDGRDDLFLWNPATREYKAFPRTSQPLSLLPDNMDRKFSTVGFGIDPITKDYKVVRIWEFCRSTRGVYIHKAEVFSLSATSCRPKSVSWKKINVVLPISQPLTRSDVAYLNGKYYWCTEPPEGHEGRPCKILWFDMGAEVFGLIESPNLCADFYWNRLGLLKESLAMVMHAYNVDDKYIYEIWILDGVSWTKYATIGPFKESEIPVGFWKNEEVIVHNSSCVDEEHEYGYATFSYDVKTHMMKKIMQHMHLDVLFPLAIYNESLVSVMGED